MNPFTQAHMIDVKQAVQAATQYARDLFADQELRHLRVEEVELTEDRSIWNITLGWVEPAIRTRPSLVPSYADGGVVKLPRVYKVFDVDAESGEVRAMKIREVD